MESRGDFPGDYIYAYAGTATAHSASGFSTSSFHQAVGRLTSPTSRNSGLDGTFGFTNTTSFSPAGVDSISVGVLKRSSATYYFDGNLSLIFLHSTAAAGGVTDSWISYEKEMLDDADQSDFYGTWSWTPNRSPVNALELGFRTGAAAAAANTALLAQANAMRRLLEWPAGDFYFNKITGVTSTTTAFDQIAWRGAASEYAWQHQEQDGQGDKQFTRFVLTDMAETDVWLDLSPRAATRIGPWRIENITFQVPTGEEGSLFRIGDPTSTNPNGISIRGLNVKDCYFTFEDQVAASYLVNDPMDDPDAGWVLSKPHGRNFAWQVTHGYDTSFEDCSLRGWYVGGEFRHNDRLLVRNWRGGFCGRTLDVYSIPGNPAVPGFVSGLWSEGQWVVGANL